MGFLKEFKMLLIGSMKICILEILQKIMSKQSIIGDLFQDSNSLTFVTFEKIPRNCKELVVDYCPWAPAKQENLYQSRPL